MREELVRLLVHAHHRHRGVVGAGVDRQDVLHPGGELGVRLRRDGPALLQMRAKFRFFRTRPMVEWSRSGVSPARATCFSSSRRLHRAWPAGGVEQASAINRASTSPVTGEGTGGCARCLRPIVALTSPPASANRFATSRNVSPETPTRAAITSLGSTSPTEVSSASSTRARLIIDAG